MLFKTSFEYINVFNNIWLLQAKQEIYMKKKEQKIICSGKEIIHFFSICFWGRQWSKFGWWQCYKELWHKFQRFISIHNSFTILMYSTLLFSRGFSIIYSYLSKYNVAFRNLIFLCLLLKGRWTYISTRWRFVQWLKWQSKELLQPDFSHAEYD